MVENLKRIREPLAWALTVLAVLGMALVGWRLSASLADPGDNTIFAIFSDAGLNWINMSIVLPLVIAVLSCSLITPATRHAMITTRVAAVVLTVGVALTLVSTLLGMWASAASVGVVLDVLGGLFDLALKALATGSLWVVVRGVRAGQIDATPATPSGPVLDPAYPVVAGQAEPDPQPQPTSWSRGQATGTVWRTASDAAAGAPGRDRLDPPDTQDS